jgi:hypothetical protein
MFDDLTDKTGDKKLVELEEIIEEGLRTFTAVGSALLQIRDGKLYQPQYSSFEDYCREKWDMEHSHAYRLMDSAKVMANLKTSPIGEVLPTNESQTRPLTSLSPEQQVEAWKEATTKAPTGKKPSARLVQRIVDRICAKAGKEKRMIKASEGWTADELKDDTELFEAFKAIAAVYGNEDTKAIRTGPVHLQRSEVIFLAKLSAEKMRSIHDLIFANRWKPKTALRFIEKKIDGDTRLNDMVHRCLGTKDKFFSVVVGGFTHTCKAPPIKPPSSSVLPVKIKLITSSLGW